MAHVLADAERAEAVGVPVDWKRMAYSILNTAQSELAAMDGAIKKQRAEIADLQDQLGLAD